MCAFRFELRVDFPDAKTAKTSMIEFDVQGLFDALQKQRPARSSSCRKGNEATKNIRSCAPKPLPKMV